MGYIQGIDINQIMMTSVDSMVERDSIARIIAVFVDSLDLKTFDFTHTHTADEGRPSYNPADLLKLYIYGARNEIRSSRKLAKACKVNIEVIWLIKGVTPDFRTISDFRKDNARCLKKVFKEFNRKLAEVLEFGYQSVDGSKFQACNSKDKNFTLTKLDDRIKRMDMQSEEYLRQIERLDATEEAESADEETIIPPGSFTKETLKEKLKVIAERRERYCEYLKYMEENNLSQLSLVDVESKLMKNKNGYQVSHNVQTSVDSNTHLITNFEVTDSATDHGQLYGTLKAIKEDGEILSAVADKGYDKAEDMAECLENGVIPNVILPEGKDSYELEVPYAPEADAEKSKDKTDSRSLKKCLESGVCPTAYEEIISDMEIVEKRVRIYESEAAAPCRSEEEMKARASEGYFVRDLDRNIVYCPAGELLRKKSEKKSGATCYCNKLACKACPYKDKCLKNKRSDKYPFKEVEFRDKEIEKPCKTWNASSAEKVLKKLGYKYRTEIIKVVRFKFTPNREQMDKRKCISEHPFGTLKRAMNGGYFLLRGKAKVTGEFSLLSIGYNLVRAFNMLGFSKMIEAMS